MNDVFKVNSIRWAPYKAFVWAVFMLGNIVSFIVSSWLWIVGSMTAFVALYWLILICVGALLVYEVKFIKKEAESSEKK